MREFIINPLNFAVVSYNPLTSTERKLLNKLYTPFIGKDATELFIYLHDLIKHEEIESSIESHTKLFVKLNIDNFETFNTIKEKLEASSLLSTYKTDSIVVYVLHDILRPIDFFDDLLLSSMLKQTLGFHEFENLQRDLLVTSYDLNEFQNVTKSFDEVYTLDCYEESTYDKWWSSVKRSRPHLLYNHFDYEVVLAQIEPLEIFELNELRSTKFYNILNSVSFCFALSNDEIVLCLIAICKANKEFDEKAFIKAAKKAYEKKLTKENVSIKPIKQSSKDNELIEILEKTNYSAVVSARFGKGLVASEIEMLESLHRKHGYGHGFINVLLIYVLSQTNGSVPALNYFLKIANEWYRKGIKTTSDALDFIENAEKEETQKPKKIYSKKPTTKAPGWVEEHLKQTKQEEVSKEESISDLEDFFNK